VHPAQPIELNPNDIHYDEYIITGSIRHDRESFREATEMISRGLIGVDDLVSETVPFERIENAFQRAGLLDTYRVVLTFGE
jgi:threonine dehydrogenase-like Zn-dependent dehydrogenase